MILSLVMIACLLNPKSQQVPVEMRKPSTLVLQGILIPAKPSALAFFDDYDATGCRLT